MGSENVASCKQSRNTSPEGTPATKPPVLAYQHVEEDVATHWWANAYKQRVERIFLEIQSESRFSEVSSVGLRALIASQEYQTGNRKDFLQKLRNGEYDDVVGLYRSNNSTSVREKSRSSKTAADTLNAGNRALRQGTDITAPQITQVHLPQWCWLRQRRR
jgi:hypothetical protein